MSTIHFKFDHGGSVFIDGIGAVGTVRSMRCEGRDKDYLVSYYANGTKYQDWFFEDELSEPEERKFEGVEPLDMYVMGHRLYVHLEGRDAEHKGFTVEQIQEAIGSVFEKAGYPIFKASKSGDVN